MSDLISRQEVIQAIRNDLISIQATLEVVRLKAQYAMIKGD